MERLRELKRVSFGVAVFHARLESVVGGLFATPIKWQARSIEPAAPRALSDGDDAKVLFHFEPLLDEKRCATQSLEDIAATLDEMGVNDPHCSVIVAIRSWPQRLDDYGITKFVRQSIAGADDGGRWRSDAELCRLKKLDNLVLREIQGVKRCEPVDV